MAAGGALTAITFAGALLDAISNATNLISPPITYVGSSIVVIGAILLHAVLRRFPLQWRTLDGTLSVYGLGLKGAMAVVGILTLLWTPRVADLLRARMLERETPDQYALQSSVLPRTPVVRPAIRMLLVDNSESLRGVPVADAVSEYIRKTDPRARIGMGVFHQNFQLLVAPARLPTSIYREKLHYVKPAPCTHIYTAIEQAVAHLRAFPKAERRLVLFTDGRESRCPGETPADTLHRDWQYETDFPDIELEFILLGQSNEAEVKRLFPAATIDKSRAGVGGMPLAQWER